MTVRDYLASLVRTTVPLAVALIGGKLLAAGIEVDETALEVVLSGVVGGGYYATVRALEARWSWTSVLLGWKATPRYDDA